VAPATGTRDLLLRRRVAASNALHACSGRRGGSAVASLSHRRLGMPAVDNGQCARLGKGTRTKAADPSAC
jgi:hypothetical protein